MSDIKKVVLAYSGGLDTSVILKWLQDVYKCEVVTFTADLGQGEELEPARAKALKAGIKAKNIYIDDCAGRIRPRLRLPHVPCQTVYEASTCWQPPSPAADRQAPDRDRNETETGADAICHGATGRQRPGALRAGRLCAEARDQGDRPWREWDPALPRKLMAYAEKHGIAIDMKHKKAALAYSMDANLLHISYEGRHLEDPPPRPRESMWRWTVSPEGTQPRPSTWTWNSSGGDLVSINGRR